MERLQKYISECGYTSRRKAEELILKGKVKVNGSVVKELGTKVTDADLIEIDNQIKEGNYNIDYCGFPNEERVILSPEETIDNYREAKEKLDERMEHKLKEILSLLGVDQ